MHSTTIFTHKYKTFNIHFIDTDRPFHKGTARYQTFYGNVRAERTYCITYIVGGSTTISKRI